MFAQGVRAKYAKATLWHSEARLKPLNNIIQDFQLKGQIHGQIYVALCAPAFVYTAARMSLKCAGDYSSSIQLLNFHLSSVHSYCRVNISQTTS